MTCPLAAAPSEPRPSGIQNGIFTRAFSRGYRPVAVGYLPPAVISAVPPIVPFPAANDEATVQVGLALVVDAQGNVAKITVTRSAGAPFDDAAKLAAALFAFRPALRSGAAVRAKVPYTVTFKRTPRGAV